MNLAHTIITIFLVWISISTSQGRKKGQKVLRDNFNPPRNPRSPSHPQTLVSHHVQNPHFGGVDNGVHYFEKEEIGMPFIETLAQNSTIKIDPTTNSSMPDTNTTAQSQTTTPTDTPQQSTESSSSSAIITTESITDVPTTSPTTTVPTTTTEVPPILSGQGESKKPFFCSCDYKIGDCDMNCCCDLDCSDADKKLFTGCTGTIYEPKSKRNKDHSCVKSYIMYTDNTPYRIDRSEKGMFCVAKENLKMAREFGKSDMDRITKKVIQKRINLRPKYTWNSLKDSLPENYFNIKEVPYKYGSVIWTVTSTEDSYEEAILRLPTSFHTSICSVLEPVKFLQDTSSSCVLPLHNVESQCGSVSELNVNHFIKPFLVIGNPTMKEENSTDYLVTGILPAVACHHNVCVSADEDEFPNPEFDKDMGVCQSVLSRLNLTFIHEGIDGITHVVAKTDLTDVPQDATEIKQDFSVRFLWNRRKMNESVQNDTMKNSTAVSALSKLPRSGNPGYIVGKPIILGRKVVGKESVSNDSKEFRTVEKIQVFPDPSQWLHIQGAGDCPEDILQLHSYPRNPVLFGFEHVATCKLRIEEFRRCGELQRHIASVIFGEEDPVAFTKRPLYVAAYGSPDAFPSDWVPPTFIDISSFLSSSSSSSLVSSGCDGIISAVHITIAYALVGPVDFPQAKITGIFYEPEEPLPIPRESSKCVTLPNADEQCNKPIRIATTVSFVDVSGKPTTRVATWPVVSIRLPADFFYPFTSSPASSGGGEIIISSFLHFFIVGVILNFN